MNFLVGGEQPRLTGQQKGFKMSNVLLLVFGIILGIVAIWLGVSYFTEVLTHKKTFKK